MSRRHPWRTEHRRQEGWQHLASMDSVAANRKAMRAMAMVVTVAAMLARVGMTDMVEKRRKVDMDSMEVVDSVRVRSSRENMADRGSLDSELERLQRAIGLCNEMRSVMLEYAMNCNFMIYLQNFQSFLFTMIMTTAAA